MNKSEIAHLNLTTSPHNFVIKHQVRSTPSENWPLPNHVAFLKSEIDQFRILLHEPRYGHELRVRGAQIQGGVSEYVRTQKERREKDCGQRVE